MKIVTAAMKVGRPQYCPLHFSVYTKGECPRCTRSRLPSASKEEAPAERSTRNIPQPLPPSL